MSQTPIYHAWQGMIRRCHYKKHPQYKDYGARGIKVFEEWRNDFGKFYDYIGDKPSSEYSIDRINNDKGYEPGNVRWATRTEQQNNTRHNTHIVIKGKSHTLAEWAKIIGISPEGFYGRIKAGWDEDRLLSKSQRQQ